ncbi:MAG: hypothetical protein GY765_29775 [bacterium]|nr:hypothetical protein [bacterium]
MKQKILFKKLSTVELKHSRGGIFNSSEPDLNESDPTTSAADDCIPDFGGGKTGAPNVCLKTTRDSGA